MKSFLKFTLATIVGIIISSVIMFFITMLIVGGIVSSATADKTTKVKKNSIIEIKLDVPVSERTSKNPLDNFNFQSMENQQTIGLNDIIMNLEKAKTDDNIKGIFLNLSVIPSGIATIEEIREALINFKDSTDKFIIAYGDFYTQGAYYIATVADKIYLNPEGLIEFKGLNAEIMFFKNTLEKLGVEPQIIRGRNNKFKSAVEPFMYTEMSDANRMQTMTYVGSIWNHLLTGISATRKISVEELNIIADSMQLTSAEKALELKFVDGLKYKDEIIAELKELSGTETNKDLRFVSLSKYTKAPKKHKEGKGLVKEKIAVIYASGQIDMGKGEFTTIGSDGLSETIREARLDSNIKAIVLRVNSPGGSALASEIIWREVVLAKEAKPVIVSMGDYAASGGYYIACPADVIVCNPTTLTGSIGVFGILWNAQELLNDKLGVKIDNVKTNQHADIGSMYRPMTASEKQVIQIEVEEVYNTFIDHVAEGRNMSIEEVDSIGQGRVWSGINAIDIGLIDEIGGLRRAVDIAVEKAELENFRIVTLPKQEDPFEMFVKELTGETETSLIKSHLGESYRYYMKAQQALKVKGIQARLPYMVDFY